MGSEFGIGEFTTHFRLPSLVVGLDWDVHWRFTGVLTHGHFSNARLGNSPSWLLRLPKWGQRLTQRVQIQIAPAEAPRAPRLETSVAFWQLPSFDLSGKSR